MQIIKILAAEAEAVFQRKRRNLYIRYIDQNIDRADEALHCRYGAGYRHIRPRTERQTLGDLRISALKTLYDNCLTLGSIFAQEWAMVGKRLGIDGEKYNRDPGGAVLMKFSSSVGCDNEIRNNANDNRRTTRLPQCLCKADIQREPRRRTIFGIPMANEEVVQKSVQHTRSAPNLCVESSSRRLQEFSCSVHS